MLIPAGSFLAGLGLSALSLASDARLCPASCFRSGRAGLRAFDFLRLEVLSVLLAGSMLDRKTWSNLRSTASA